MDALLLAIDNSATAIISDVARRADISVSTLQLHDSIDPLTAQTASGTRNRLLLVGHADCPTVLRHALPGDVVACVDHPSTDATITETSSSAEDATDQTALYLRIHRTSPEHLLAEVAYLPDDPRSHTLARQLAGQLIDWKLPAIVIRGTQGLIIDRLLSTLFVEAIRLHEEGIFSMQETDSLMQTFGGWCTGPFAFMDDQGLDEQLATIQHTYQVRNLDSPPLRMLAHLVEKQNLGRKSGQGFYLYDALARLPACNMERKNFALTPLLEGAILAFAARCDALDAASTEHYALARLHCTVINEAARMFDEGLAQSDAIDIAWQGLGFALGPLQLADQIGHRTVRGVLHAMNDALESDRYQTARLFDS